MIRLECLIRGLTPLRQSRSSDWAAFADSGLLPLLADFCAQLSARQEHASAAPFRLQPESQLFLRDVVSAGLRSSSATGQAANLPCFLTSAMLLQMCSSLACRCWRAHSAATTSGLCQRNQL